tara:strand:+ start:415 stop:582 length:168 start_codon:yes stop_codon:yes gene_type:complete
MKVSSLVRYNLSEVEMFHRDVGIVLDIDWGNEQALVCWTGNATHYEYIDELELIQ